MTWEDHFPWIKEDDDDDDEENNILSCDLGLPVVELPVVIFVAVMTKRRVFMAVN